MKDADWSQLLEQLQLSLEQAAIELQRHEQNLASPLLTGDAASERPVSWQDAIERFGQRMDEYRGFVERAEKAVGVAEAALVERGKQVQQYQARLEQVRQQLANVPAAAIE